MLLQGRLACPRVFAGVGARAPCAKGSSCPRARRFVILFLICSGHRSTMGLWWRPRAAVSFQCPRSVNLCNSNTLCTRAILSGMNRRAKVVHMRRLLFQNRWAKMIMETR